MWHQRVLGIGSIELAAHTAHDRGDCRSGLRVKTARVHNFADTFDAEDTRTATEIGEAETILSKLPVIPDHDAIERQWGEIRELAAALGGITSLAARTTLLRGLGVVVFGSGGTRIRYRAEFRDLFGVC